MNWTDFKTVASFIGIPGAMMAVLVWSLAKGWFITGREFTRLEKDRDEWKERALQAWQQAERLTTTAQTAVEHAAKVTDGMGKK